MRAFARASPFPGVKNQLALRGLNEPLDGPLSSIGTLHSEESPSQFGPGVPLKRRGGSIAGMYRNAASALPLANFNARGNAMSQLRYVGNDAHQTAAVS